MDDPDVIARIHGDTGNGPEDPMIGKGLRPKRVDLKTGCSGARGWRRWRGSALGLSQSLLKRRLANTYSEEGGRAQTQTKSQLSLHILNASSVGWKQRASV
jgi:hypothetical protein